MAEHHAGAVPDRWVFDTLPRAILTTDVDGVITRWNRSAERLFGWTEDEVLGRSATELLLVPEDRALADLVRTGIAGGSEWNGDLLVVARHREPVRVFAAVRPVRAPDGSIVGVLAAAEDVSRQRVAERRAAELSEQLRVALDAGGLGTWRWDRATGITEWDATLEQLFGLDPGEFDGTFEAWVGLLHPDDRDEVLRVLDEAIVTKSTYTVEHRIVCPDGTIRWVQGKGTVTLDDVGEVTGTIGCAGDVTDQVEAAAERERVIEQYQVAVEQERVSRERLEFLGRINEAALTSTDVAELMRNVACSAVPRLGDWCTVYVLPTDGREVPDVEIGHVDPEMLAYARELLERFPYDPAATSGVPEVIRSGNTVFVPDVDERLKADADSRAEARAIARELRIRSVIVVPIRKWGRTLGAIQFVNAGESRSFTEDDVALARLVAGRIASSVENLRLADQLRRDQFRNALDALLDDVTIARTVRNEDGQIVDFVIEFMNSASRDGAGRGPEELVGRRMLDAYPQWRDSGMFDAFSKVVEHRESLVMDRVRYDDLTRDGTPISGWWTMQVVPFEDGYLACSRDETQAVIAERELQAARDEQQRARLAVELLQAVALPTVLPSHPGLELGVRYEPAQDEVPVGGDWYDVFEIPGRSAIGVVIADVAGHGPAAAQTMVQVRNALRAFAMEGHEPNEVLQRTDAVLGAGGEPVPFVTCCYLLVEPGEGRARWSNAGHLPPVLLRAGDAAPLPRTPGIPLGIDASHRYETASWPLVAGDLFVLFTDGLVERRSEPIDVGLTRLARTLASLPDGHAQQVLDRLTTGMLADHHRSDDVAAIAVRVTIL